MGDEYRNPFGGFLFSGPEDALSRLAGAAETDGLKLVPVELGDETVRLCLPSQQAFGAAGMSLVTRAQAGEFGSLSLGLLGGPIRPPH